MANLLTVIYSLFRLPVSIPSAFFQIFCCVFFFNLSLSLEFFFRIAAIFFILRDCAFVFYQFRYLLANPLQTFLILLQQSRETHTIYSLLGRTRNASTNPATMIYYKRNIFLLNCVCLIFSASSSILISRSLSRFYFIVIGCTELLVKYINSLDIICSDKQNEIKN